MAGALAAGFNLRRLDATGVAIALDETVTREELDRLCALFGGRRPGAAVHPERAAAQLAVPAQPVFTAHHSEHAMLRYLKRLEDRDVALNRGMIPLGSCTMKLNATAEMMPITLAGLRRHPPVRPGRPDRRATRR